LSADAAGMQVIAVPNRAFPPGKEALDRTARILSSLEELTPSLIESIGSRRPGRAGP
jgi:hypothetical protein